MATVDKPPAIYIDVIEKVSGPVIHTENSLRRINIRLQQLDNQVESLEKENKKLRALIVTLESKATTKKGK